MSSNTEKAIKPIRMLEHFLRQVQVAFESSRALEPKWHVLISAAADRKDNPAYADAGALCAPSADSFRSGFLFTADRTGNHACTDAGAFFVPSAGSLRPVWGSSA